ncbi:hypothetical protein [Plebeiibacterium sediminum]|uniref:Secretin/TonB short N-terminal domain-containing protein n=1 Tax=Plebeiibacterium sediminum TaxID=2992112 RepID=A0AAE3M535_9BACT|nr:hypothetical protein [Plebeiobacterium sediminum]MCW3786820.1 hypothetical protein [Plebeiobacterium sediminum]
MKNIRFILIGVVSVIIFMSCGNTQSSNNQAHQTISENTSESNDTIKGRGCFEIVSDIPYDIPAQRFDETAQILAHASGCFIETDLSKTGSVDVNAIKGKMSIRDAILVAIEGTNLKITEETEVKIKVELIK